MNAVEPLVVCRFTHVYFQCPLDDSYGTLTSRQGGRTLRSAEDRSAVLKALRRIQTDTTWPLDRTIGNLEKEWEGQIHL